MVLKWGSKIYGYLADRRNKAFDRGDRASVEFDRPLISVGNLNTGGTGKTPHVEYLIRLLQPDHRLAVLSRGYGRRTRGYRLAGSQDSAATLGDEPFQYHSKFADSISVAVAIKRVPGVSELIADVNPEVILLDDAFQHRSIRPGFQLLLTTYQDPYTRDQLLPVGRLREPAPGADRADAILVTKCPADLNNDQRITFKKELGPKPHQRFFFSTFAYGTIRPQGDTVIRHPKKVIALAGIARPEPFVEELERRFQVVAKYLFRDHHRFTRADLQRLRRDVQALFDEETVIVTTEKDLMRLLPLRNLWADWPLYTLPVEAKVEPKDEFDEMILNYVGKGR